MSNNIDLKKIVINVEETLGTNLMLVDAPRAVYRYEKEQRTDELLGFLYSVLCPAMSYEKINIKVAGNKPILDPDEWAGGALPVAFTNLHLSLSQDFRTKAIRLLASSDAIRLVEQKG